MSVKLNSRLSQLHYLMVHDDMEMILGWYQQGIRLVVLALGNTKDSSWGSLSAVHDIAQSFLYSHGSPLEYIFIIADNTWSQGSKIFFISN